MSQSLVAASRRKVHAVSVGTFGGPGPANPGNAVSTLSIFGSIDRVTRDVEALSALSGKASTSYTLKCRPTQRMF
jgi:hypothetical protein